MSRTLRIAAIPGDGIGPEVLAAGLEVVSAAARDCGLQLHVTPVPWGCDYYVRPGGMMDADGLARLQEFDAIYFGAVGAPSVPDHVSVWELILPIRQRVDQYVNLRPMRLLPGIACPLGRATPARCSRRTPPRPAAAASPG